MPHPAQATGQHVLEHAPEEVDQRQGAVGGVLGLRVAIAEGDAALHRVVADQVVFANHAAIQVARQVLQSGFAVTDLAAVDDPLLRQADGQGQSGVAQGAQHLRAEHAGEGEGVEEVAAFELPPLSALGEQSAAGHGALAEFGFELVLAEALEGGGSRAKQGVVDEARCGTGKAAQAVGEGEGDREVVDREQLLALTLQPLQPQVSWPRRAARQVWMARTAWW